MKQKINFINKHNKEKQLKVGDIIIGYSRDDKDLYREKNKQVISKKRKIGEPKQGMV